MVLSWNSVAYKIDLYDPDNFVGDSVLGAWNPLDLILNIMLVKAIPATVQQSANIVKFSNKPSEFKTNCRTVSSYGRHMNRIVHLAIQKYDCLWDLHPNKFEDLPRLKKSFKWIPSSANSRREMFRIWMTQSFGMRENQRQFGKKIQGRKKNTLETLQIRG